MLENRLHDLVCAGSMTLRHAQHVESSNWVDAYKRYVGAPMPGPATHASAHHGAARRHVGSGRLGNCKPGYSPCLPVVPDLNCDANPSNEMPVRVSGKDPVRHTSGTYRRRNRPSDGNRNASTARCSSDARRFLGLGG